MTVYEPEALFPSVSVVDAWPLLPVVALVEFNDAFPSPDVILTNGASLETELGY